MRALSTDELAEIVWDGQPPERWPTALRALISKVRSALGILASIEHALGCYQLRLPPDAWIDVEAADATVHEAETAFRDGVLERAMGHAPVANAIARRPFLPGDAGVAAGNPRSSGRTRPPRSAGRGPRHPAVARDRGRLPTRPLGRRGVDIGIHAHQGWGGSDADECDQAAVGRRRGDQDRPWD